MFDPITLNFLCLRIHVLWGTVGLNHNFYAIHNGVRHSSVFGWDVWCSASLRKKNYYKVQKFLGCKWYHGIVEIDESLKINVLKVHERQLVQVYHDHKTVFNSSWSSIWSSLTCCIGLIKNQWSHYYLPGLQNLYNYTDW